MKAATWLRVPRTLVVLGTICLAMLMAGSAGAQEDEAARALVHEGLQQLRDAYMADLQGEEAEAQYDAAYTTIENALAKNPSHELMLFLREEIGTDLLVRLLMKEDHRIRNTAMRVLEAAKAIYDRKEISEEQIRSTVAKLKAEDLDARLLAMQELAQIGQRAAPCLIENLSSNADEVLRVNAILALTRMGDEVVLPVVEALNHPDETVRMNSAIVLGNIGDPRAMAELRRLHEAGGEFGTVQDAVVEALFKITGRDPGQLPCAREAYYQLGERYYRSDPSVLPKVYGDAMVWKWDPGTNLPKGRVVAPSLLNEELAEEACFDALRIDTNYDDAWALLVANYFAKYLDSRLSLELLRKLSASGEISAEEVQKLEAALQGLERSKLFGRLVGAELLCQALYRSVQIDDNAPVAVECLKALKDSARAEYLPLPPAPEEVLSTWTEEQKAAYESERLGRFGGALVYALLDEDKRVRYAAAELLVSLEAHYPYLGYDRVVPVLAEAVTEHSIRSIVLGDTDPQNRNQLSQVLSELGYHVVAAGSVAEVLARAKRFPTPDLILLNSNLADAARFRTTIAGQTMAETVLDSLAKDVRTKALPVLLLCDPGVAEVRGAKDWVSVTDFLARTPGKDELKAALEAAFQTPEAQQDAKARAVEVAAQAANTLASIDPTQTIYANYAVAVPAMNAVLADRPDAIRLPVMRALARLGEGSSVPALVSVMQDAENSEVATRAEAGHTIALILRRTGGRLEEAVFNVLTELLNDPELDIQVAAAEALGNAGLSEEQKRALFEMKRYED